MVLLPQRSVPYRAHPAGTAPTETDEPTALMDTRYGRAVTLARAAGGREHNNMSQRVHLRQVIFVPTPTLLWISNSSMSRFAPGSPMPIPLDEV